jgi:hypothetical protein
MDGPLKSVEQCSWNLAPLAVVVVQPSSSGHWGIILQVSSALDTRAATGADSVARRRTTGVIMLSLGCEV